MFRNDAIQQKLKLAFPNNFAVLCMRLQEIDYV